jgi:hypothetical protein
MEGKHREFSGLGKIQDQSGLFPFGGVDLADHAPGHSA